MSSKRGRKRNDNLPPNRARDVQRAFRARRLTHLEALEQRIEELEKENEYYRKALNLPPPSRPPLGRGPTGRDQPDDDADKSRRQTVSPLGESAGSPSSCASFHRPELRSLVAPSMSSHKMMMGVGSPHRTMVADERDTPLSERGDRIGESIPISAPMTVKTPGFQNHSDLTLPPLHSPSIAIYHQKTTGYFPTAEAFIENNFDASQPQRRKALNETSYCRSPNYPNSDQYLHTAATMYPEPYRNPNLLHREWNPPPSNHVHTFQDQGFPESRRFPGPPELVHPSHSPIDRPPSFWDTS